jgi:hypothetical protein
MYCLMSARSTKAESVGGKIGTRGCQKGLSGQRQRKERGRTDGLSDVGGGHDEDVLSVLELVQLGQEGVDDL